MSNPTSRILEQVPLHYREQAQGFITFLEKYYEWLYRDSGLSYEEIQDLKSDTSWISNSVEKFTSSSLNNDLTIENDELNVLKAIIDYSRYRSSGEVSQSLINDYLLEDDHQEFMTADGELFLDKSSASVECNRYSDKFMDMWYDQAGYVRPKSSMLNRVDEVLFVSLLKHLNAIKGTFKSMQLFFSVFFEENDIELYIPKFDIATIDDNWIPDSQGYLRDDMYYDEFTYEILVRNSPETYEKLFNEVFMKHIHPAGFNVYLTQKVS